MNSSWRHNDPGGDSEQQTSPLTPLKVLVVDDSATVRQVLAAVLSEKHGFRVTVAADPLIAMEEMKESLPDVILLDLEMPRMDGMTFLHKLMGENPLPVIICSGLTGTNTDAAIRALENGAVDIISKPKIGIRGFLARSFWKTPYAPQLRLACVDRVGAKIHLPTRSGRKATRL